MRHPPAHRRDVIRRLKQGQPPAGLLEDAREIEEPGHAAAALLAVAQRMSPREVQGIVEEAVALLMSVDRPARLAEAWGDALEYGSKLPARSQQALEAACLDAVAAMPDGEWTADAIIAVAPNIEARHRLMERALANPGFEADAARALLRIDPGLEPMVRNGPPEVAARVLGALEQAFRVEDRDARREALRVAIWKMDTFPDELDAPASDRAHALTLIGAREDRLGKDPVPRFEAARAAIAEAPAEDRPWLQRKLAAAMERSGLPPPPIEESQREEREIPVAATQRHTLAIVDGYGGGLGPAHLRAIARAAPLAVAFNLDLALIGFPSDDLAQMVDLVERDSNVGEGEGYTRTLLESGRLSLLPLEHGVPAAWPGKPVATTPHPAEGKRVELAFGGPICLLIGLGKQGLPKRMLEAVPHHHELTGQGISLETATAMGILADRLGRTPL